MDGYAYNINFKDGGKIVLEEALTSFISVCEQHLSKGQLVPYTAYQILAENMLDQISKNKFSAETIDDDDEAFGIFKEIEEI